jgi:hypothetical protein
MKNQEIRPILRKRKPRRDGENPAGLDFRPIRAAPLFSFAELRDNESRMDQSRQTPSSRRVCVFCGSKAGFDDRYRDAARELGTQLVRDGFGLVFGGGSVGLMGVVADAVLEAGGDVVGVLPKMLAVKELLHPGVPDMRLVADMHERKARMAELAGAFVALPGGFGTFEELFEVITWAQLGIHRKTIGLLNTAGYFDPLVRMLDHAIQEGFIKESHRGLIVVEDRPAALLATLQTHELPVVKRWLGPDAT